MIKELCGDVDFHGIYKKIQMAKSCGDSKNKKKLSYEIVTDFVKLLDKHKKIVQPDQYLQSWKIVWKNMKAIYQMKECRNSTNVSSVIICHYMALTCVFVIRTGRYKFVITVQNIWESMARWPSSSMRVGGICVKNAFWMDFTSTCHWTTMEKWLGSFSFFF